MSWKRQQTKQVFDYIHHSRRWISSFLPGCQEDTVRVHSPEEMLCGASWTRIGQIQSPVGTSQRNRNLQRKSKHFPSHLKSPTCSPFPKAPSGSHHSSLACGMWVGHKWGVICHPCMSQRPLRSFETNHRNRKYLCLWQMSLKELSILSCQPGTGLMLSSTQLFGSLSAHQRWHYAWFLHDIFWRPRARSNGAKWRSACLSLPLTYSRSPFNP